MKRILALLLVSVMIFAVAACNKDVNNELAVEETEKQDEIQLADIQNIASEFFEIFKSGKYSMKARVELEDLGSAVIEICADGDAIATKTDVGGMVIRSVVLGSKVYAIMDDSQMIVVTDAKDNTDNGRVQTDGMEYSVTGRGDFAGKNLPYQEYMNESGVRTQYFVEGNQLLGVRTITEEATVDLEIIEIGQDVPSGAFEIPSEYRIVDMGY